MEGRTEATEKKRDRKPPPGYTRLLILMPIPLVERLDAYAEFLRERNPGINVSRSDALRAALVSIFDAKGGGSFSVWEAARKARTGTGA